jgi:hypothetical protein
MKLVIPGAVLDEIRRAARTLPGVVEGTSYGTPAFKLGKKLFARVHQDGESLVVAIDPLEREIALKADPDLFFITPHYADHPWVQVRLSAVRGKQLAKILAAAHRTVEERAPRAAPARRSPGRRLKPR